jgi:amidase
MIKRLALLLVLLLPTGVAAQTAGAEQWVVTTDLYGNARRQTLTLRDQAGALTGDLDGDAVQGERRGSAIRFTVKGSDGSVSTFSGVLAGERLNGEADQPDTNDAKARAVHRFTAWQVPARPAGGPRRVEFMPTSYANAFSADRTPVLTIWPGDVVHTTTVDSGGVDENGVTRALYGNPQTGPFFVAGAKAGDVLAVRIRRLTLNRDWADSLDDIVGRARSTRLAARAGELGKPVRWTLDRQRGIARPNKPSPGLKDFTIPLRPMLGGLGVAPDFGFPPISTGDTGRFGGNMDFNAIGEGATVYLPVFQPGALLYLGDAHAAQGEGETTQFALETSMDVEFSVEILPARPIAGPRVETATHIAVLGQAGSADDAIRAATAGMVQWLEQDYGLTLPEAAQVLGTSVQYSVATLAGQNVGMVAKLEKARLTGLKPKPD